MLHSMQHIIFIFLFYILLTAWSPLSSVNCVHQKSNSINTVVVIGANGDLAKRKIWPSIQEMYFYYNYHNFSSPFLFSSLHIYAATREPTEITSKIFSDYFANLTCASSWLLSNDSCTKLNSELAQLVTPIQLKTENDYIELNQLIETKTNLIEKKTESVRIFYLSIPPFAYKTTCHFINSFARPTNQRTKLRIAIEKPLGKNLTSAKKLANSILDSLSENEVFLVDHYLHKRGVKNIIDFRKFNPRMLTSRISNIEIVVRELLDVKGRTRYYNEYGVIRDMLQNHLTELLTLLTSDLTTNLTFATNDKGQFDKGQFDKGKGQFDKGQFDKGKGQFDKDQFDKDQFDKDQFDKGQLDKGQFDKGQLNKGQFNLNTAKLDVLKRVYSPFIDSTVLGQYSGYKEHLLLDGTLLNTSISNTLTFAAVLINIRSPILLDVPIILMSGKRLGSRQAFVRVTFKGPTNLKRQKLNIHDHYNNCDNNYVLFDLDKACVVVPLNSYTYNVPDEWTSTRITETPDCLMTELCPPLTGNVQQTYRYVLENLIDGRSDLFVPLSNVLESWRIWSPLVEEIEQDKNRSLLYYTDTLLDEISFTINGSKLIPTRMATGSDGTSNVITVEDMNQNVFKFGSIWSDKNQSKFVPQPADYNIYELSRSHLAHDLSSDIYHTAMKIINGKGNPFHIALPGGSSPLDIYQSILINYRYTLPWQHTHLWQTDERCNIPTNSIHSNIHQLSKHLIEHIPIPYTNIHPLYTACHCKHQSCEYSLAEHFNYVLLGVGRDGHIASLFNVSTELVHDDNNHLLFVTLPPDYPIHIKNRVSLRMSKLLEAERISLVITGLGKCHLTKLLYNYNDRTSNDGTSEMVPFLKLLQRGKPGQINVWIDKNICQEKE